MKSNIFYSFYLLFILQISVACKTVNTVSPHESAANNNIISDDRVITDPVLNSAAQIVSVRESVSSSGFKKVQVEILNKSSRPRHIEYLFEWLDQDGILIKSSSRSFKVVELLGKESKFLTDISPSPSASDFRLKIVRSKR